MQKTKEKNRLQKINSKAEIKNPKINFLRFIFYGLFVAALIFSSLKFYETVVYDENGEVVALSEKQMNKFLADSAKMQKCVQYALLAEEEGFYAVCGSPKMVYLKKNEVWKYGVTCEEKPSERYTRTFLVAGNVYFAIQFRGNIAECYLEEKRKLAMYPLLPENIARSAANRLVLPPGNCKNL